MSTILDALRKLQRERSAQAPDRDLRGSVTHETAYARRRRGSGARNLAFVLALLAIGGGGFLAYRSGQLQGVLARFGSSSGEAEDLGASEEELAIVERELRELEAAAEAQAAQEQAANPAVSQPAPAPAPVARLPRNAAQPPGAGAPAGESPELLAERARLEAALANARAAHEAQARSEFDAQAAQQAAPSPSLAAAANDAAANTPAPPPPAPTATPKRAALERKPTAAAAAPKTAAAKPSAPPKPREPIARKDAEPELRAAPRAADVPAATRSAFPDVRVESIRWHPVAERRVASLRFELQDAPEAREGDIVAGVLVYRIDPGSVELRVGSAQRTVLPGP